MHVFFKCAGMLEKQQKQRYDEFIKDVLRSKEERKLRRHS